MSIKSLFQDIADAIKEKNSGVVTITPAQMPQAILNIPSSGGLSENIIKYIENYLTYGIEYTGYIYGNTQMINDLELSLLADRSQGGDNITLSDSLNNYSAVILQGVYQGQRTSQYNTSMLYISPQLNKAYWAGMKDRNQNYTCNVTFTSDTTATLTGNRQCIIYGMKQRCIYV